MDDKEQLFKELIATSKNSIYRISYSFLDDPEDIKDLRQEIFIELWKSMDRFKGESSWNTYIYRIAVNTSIRFKTTLGKRKSVETPIKQSVIKMAEDQSEKKERLNLLQQSIKKLPDNDRMLISLVLEDLSYKEIADVLNMNIGNVGVKIGRVKKKLKELMENADR